MLRIPNYFHFVFGLKKQLEPFHLMYYICLHSCVKVNQPDKIFFYYVYEPFGIYWELIKPDLELVKVSPNDFVNNFKYTKIGRKRNSYAHQADFIRLEKLIEKGGVYADMDTLFVKKLPESLFEKSFVLGREPDIISETTGEVEASLCNALIMAEPNAPFAEKWLEQMQAHFDGSWSNHSTILPQKLSEKYPHEIHIEPQESFYYFDWTPEDLRDLFVNKVEPPDSLYSVHLWKHIWFSKWKNDILVFNGDMITEDHLNSEATTYATLARPYLPKKEEKYSALKPSLTKTVGKRIQKGVSDIGYFFTKVAAKIQYISNSQ